MEDLFNITFKEFVNNCRVLKTQYDELFTPFFMAKTIRCWKVMIYSLNMPEWKKDKIWNFLNGDMEYDDLVKLKNL